MCNAAVPLGAAFDGAFADVAMETPLATNRDRGFLSLAFKKAAVAHRLEFPLALALSL